MSRGQRKERDCQQVNIRTYIKTYPELKLGSMVNQTKAFDSKRRHAGRISAIQPSQKLEVESKYSQRFLTSKILLFL